MMRYRTIFWCSHSWSKLMEHLFYMYLDRNQNSQCQQAAESGWQRQVSYRLLITDENNSNMFTSQLLYMATTTATVTEFAQQKNMTTTMMMMAKTIEQKKSPYTYKDPNIYITICADCTVSKGEQFTKQQRQLWQLLLKSSKQQKETQRARKRERKTKMVKQFSGLFLDGLSSTEFVFSAACVLWQVHFFSQLLSLLLCFVDECNFFSVEITKNSSAYTIRSNISYILIWRGNRQLKMFYTVGWCDDKNLCSQLVEKLRFRPIAIILICVKLHREWGAHTHTQTKANECKHLIKTGKTKEVESLKYRIMK